MSKPPDNSSRNAENGLVAATWEDISTLKAWDKNPRKEDENTKRVAESIKRFGFGAPIVARKEDREIIAGHTRVRAAKLLGMARVPVRFVDLSPEEAHLLALADNRLNELGAWDDKALTELLAELRRSDCDVALVSGWSDSEIDKLLKTDGIEAGASKTVSEETAFSALKDSEEPSMRHVSFILSESQREALENAIKRCGLGKDRAAALTRICVEFCS